MWSRVAKCDFGTLETGEGTFRKYVPEEKGERQVEQQSESEAAGAPLEDLNDSG